MDNNGNVSPLVFSVKDLQQLLSISLNVAYELVRSGQIRSIRIGRTYRIPREAVEEYLRNGQKSNRGQSQILCKVHLGCK